MKKHYLQLFNAMVEELEQFAQSDLNEAKRFEQSFWISRSYNTKLIELLGQYPLLNEIDEVDFFRNVKPKFTCFTEFFTIASESLMCVPDSPQRAIAFWNDELQRNVRFRRRYSSFINYYESGKVNLDREYFSRSVNLNVGSLNTMIFGGNLEYHSLGDWLVRSMLAHQMYSRFAEDKVRESFEDLRSEAFEIALADTSSSMIASFRKQL